MEKTVLRSRSIGTKVSDEEYEQLERLAQARGVTPGEGVNSGSISVGNVPSNGVGTTNGYFSPISVIAPDALDDPSTVIHEWIHQTQTVGNPFFIFLKGANQLQARVNSKLLEGAPEGFLDTSAQAVANKIVSVCGVK